MCGGDCVSVLIFASQVYCCFVKEIGLCDIYHVHKLVVPDMTIHVVYYIYISLDPTVPPTNKFKVVMFFKQKTPVNNSTGRFLFKFSNNISTSPMHM